MFKPIRWTIFFLLMLLFAAPSVSLGEIPVDLGRVKAHTVTFFYPGTTSYEFLISDDHRLGARNITKIKKNCRRCHLSKKNELDLCTDYSRDGDGQEGCRGQRDTRLWPR